MEKEGLGTNQWNLRAVDLIKNSFLVVSLVRFLDNRRRKRADRLYKPLYVLVNMQPLVALFMKLSFHIYFLQIFSPKPLLRWSIYIGAFVTIAFYIAITVALFVLSTPRPGVTFGQQFTAFLSKKSSPVLNTTFAFGYFNIFSDLYILILPISGVMGLNLRPKRKLGVILIFMTGLL